MFGCCFCPKNVATVRKILLCLTRGAAAPSATSACMPIGLCSSALVEFYTANDRQKILTFIGPVVFLFVYYTYLDDFKNWSGYLAAESRFY